MEKQFSTSSSIRQSRFTSKSFNLSSSKRPPSAFFKEHQTEDTDFAEANNFVQHYETINSISNDQEQEKEKYINKIKKQREKIQKIVRKFDLQKQCILQLQKYVKELEQDNQIKSLQIQRLNKFRTAHIGEIYQSSNSKSAMHTQFLNSSIIDITKTVNLHSKLGIYSNKLIQNENRQKQILDPQATDNKRKAEHYYEQTIKKLKEENYILSLKYNKIGEIKNLLEQKIKSLTNSALQCQKCQQKQQKIMKNSKQLKKLYKQQKIWYQRCEQFQLMKAKAQSMQTIIDKLTSQSQIQKQKAKQELAERKKQALYYSECINQNIELKKELTKCKNALKQKSKRQNKFRAMNATKHEEIDKIDRLFKSVDLLRNS